MSAFWIPSLGSQIYAMNGMHSQLNLKGKQEGVYTGYTTNINGEGYAKMTFKAKVVSAAEFDTMARSAAASSSIMDMSEYEKLATPASVTDERTYTMPDANLFSSISSKYGHSHSMSHKEHAL
jgi:cytochrome o ubiquinol oxidase subunit 2